jgi:2,3-bisphosphoglycerate-independent phosphoglycerate mutase
VNTIITATDYGLMDQPPFLIPAPHAKPTLLDILESERYRLCTVAETEKYAHVTYFFNGGREIVRPHETRIIIPSYPLRSHAERPEMRAPEITQQVIDAYHSHDFLLVNYANADMIGHTGNRPATHAALGVLSESLTRLEHITRKNKGTLIITADHGNAEAIDTMSNHMPHTMHTHARVPFIVISDDEITLSPQLRGLADVTPWLLRKLRISVPTVMSGS